MIASPDFFCGTVSGNNAVRKDTIRTRGARLQISAAKLCARVPRASWSARKQAVRTTNVSSVLCVCVCFTLRSLLRRKVRSIVLYVAIQGDWEQARLCRQLSPRMVSIVLNSFTCMRLGLCRVSTSEIFSLDFESQRRTLSAVHGIEFPTIFARGNSGAAIVQPPWQWCVVHGFA